MCSVMLPIFNNNVHLGQTHFLRELSFIISFHTCYASPKVTMATAHHTEDKDYALLNLSACCFYKNDALSKCVTNLGCV